MLKRLIRQRSKVKEKERTSTIVMRENTINPEQQILIAERDDLLEAQKVYERRVNMLETEAADLLKSYDILYNENQILRGKLDGPDTTDPKSVQNLESYNVIFKDRQYLKEANKALKRKVKQLDDDYSHIMKQYNDINTENKLLRQKAEILEQHSSRANDDKIMDLEKHKKEMDERFVMFLKEREQYIYKIAEMDKERNELQNKYDFLLIEKKDLNLKCEILESDRTKMRDKITDLEGKIPDPEKKAKDEQLLLSLQAQVIAQQISNKDATATIERLRLELQELNKQLQSRDHLIDRATSVMSVSQEEEEKQKQELEKQEELEEELKESKQRCILLLKENDGFKLRNIDLESINANLELEQKSLLKDLEEKENTIRELSHKLSTNAGLNDELGTLEEKVKDLTASKTALENELKQDRRLSKDRIRDLEAVFNESKLKLKAAENRCIKLESDRDRFQEEYSSLAKSVESHMLEVRNIKSRNEQLQNLHEDKNEKYEEIKKKFLDVSGELRDLKIEHNITKQELEEFKSDRKGHINILDSEMKTIKEDRQGETDQMKKETERLKQEITRLKDFEFKMTTMDAEMRRLMNRLRMAERYRKVERIKAGNKDISDIDEDREQLKELRRKIREMDKEKMGLLQEKRQWEITKERLAELQMANKRLIQENKRVRTDWEDMHNRAGTFETKLRSMNVKLDERKETRPLQVAKYVDTPSNKQEKSKIVQKRDKTKQPVKRLKPIPEKTETDHFGDKLVHEIQDFLTSRKTTARQITKPKMRRRVERQSTRLASDNSRMRATKPTLPKLQPDSERAATNKGSYRDLHLNKSKHKGSLELL